MALRGADTQGEGLVQPVDTSEYNHLIINNCNSLEFLFETTFTYDVNAHTHTQSRYDGHE